MRSGQHGRLCAWRVAAMRAMTASAALLAGFSHCTAAYVDTSPPPVEAFFSHPQTLTAKLSPSGDLVAIINRAQGEGLALFIAPADNFSRVKPIVEGSGTDLANVMWVNDQRLVVVAGDIGRERSAYQGNVFAVNREGGEAVSLILEGAQENAAQAPGSPHVLGNNYTVLTTLNDGSDDIIVGKRSFTNDGAFVNILPYRLNTRTTQIRSLSDGAPAEHARQWVFDANGEPRAFTSIEDGRRLVYLRDATGKWDRVGDFSGTDGGFTPEFFGTDDVLYVSAPKANGEVALYRWDASRQQVAPSVLIDLPGFDYDGSPVMDRASKRVLGVRYETDAGGTIWFDSRMKGFQAQIDKILGATYNRIECINCLSSRYLVVESSGERTPPHFYLYDTHDAHLVEIGNAYPDITRADCGARDFVSFKARDGLSIPMYVTKPARSTAGPWPAIVLVHDGPWQRGDYWEWDRKAQFLASRGYLVLQPEYRGSTGFGDALYRGGFLQFGLAMQDDLTDAARWAIDKGLADPRRVGIGGESYGGYATLIALAKDPGVFRAGFEWAGMTDSTSIFEPVWDDTAFAKTSSQLSQLIGDPVGDRAKLMAISPIQIAGQVTEPVLMAYGVDDRKVPQARANAFHAAVAANNPRVEWIVYTGENHEWHSAKDEIDFWTRVDKFLDTYLKHPPAQ
jgi:dipeptidyl aminopeptidase/acylaminoacyl peptidase